MPDISTGDNRGAEPSQLVEPDEPLSGEFWSSGIPEQNEDALRDELQAKLALTSEDEAQSKENHEPRKQPKAPKFTKLSNPLSGFDATLSGVTRLGFSPGSGLVSAASLVGVFTSASDAVSAGYDLYNAHKDLGELKREKKASEAGNSLFLKNHAEIVSIRTKIKASDIAPAEKQALMDYMKELKTGNRELASHVISHDKAASNMQSARLTLIEKSFRAVRDFVFGPSGAGVGLAKFADFIQTGAVVKLTDFASKAVSTGLGAGVAIGGAVAGACIGTFHLLQSIPEMMRWGKRVDEQATLCNRLARINRNNIGEIIGKARAMGPVDASVVEETKDILAHVAERSTVENKHALKLAKAEFAKSIIRCVFGLGSIVLGILGFFFPPVAFAALLFGAIYGMYVGIHTLVMRGIAAKQAKSQAAEGKVLAAKPDGSPQRDLTGNSAWLLTKVCGYLQGRAHDANGRFQSGAVKRLLLDMGMDKPTVKAVQAIAEAIDGIEEPAEKAKAVHDLQQELRYYLFDGGMGRKSPAGRGQGSIAALTAVPQ